VLDNFCQHRHFELDYMYGITGITGRNGCGKSNLIHAGQYFAITGKTPPGWVKADLLNWNAAAGQTVFVFEKDALTYTLTRNLHDSAVTLEWKTGEGVRRKEKASDANNTMQSILGMSADTFYETAFIPQDKIVEVVTMTHAQRMEFFQTLAGVKKAEAIRTALQDAASKFPTYVDRKAEIEKLEVLIAQYEKTAQKAKESAQQFAELKNGFEEQIPGVNEILTMPTQAMHEDFVKRAEKTLFQAIAQRDKLLQANKAEVVPEAVVSEEERKCSERWAQRQKLELDYKQLEQEFCELGTAPVHPSDPSILEKEVEELRSRVSDADKVCKLLEQGKCPTCGKPYSIENPEEYHKQYRKAYQLLTEKHSEHQRQKVEFLNGTQKSQRWIAQRDLLLKNKEAAEKKLDTVPKVAFDPEAFTCKSVAAARYTGYLQAKARIEDELRSEMQKIAAAEQSLEVAKNAAFASDEMKQNAKIFAANYKEITGKLNDANSSVTTAEAQMKFAQQNLLLYRQEQEKKQRIGKTIELFERAREVLHRDNLPKVVMRKMLDSLNNLIEGYLDLFEAEFSAYIDQDFDFLVNFPHKQDVPARVLSGGQKVALSIAFHFALSQLLASSVTLLVLDEPTVWLDDANKPVLVEVLKLVRRYAEKGVYVTVSTHDPILYPAFSKLIEL
jgi:DNA repair exonuclease SbcCD ATPase subunit